MARDDIKSSNPTDRTAQGSGVGGGTGSRNVGGSNPTSSRPGNEGSGTTGTNFGTGNTGGSFGGGTGSTGSNIGGSTSGTRTFRCSDAGYAGCPYEVSGRTDEELRPQIEQHGRQQHGIKEFGEDMWNKVRNVIRERRAA